MTLNYASQRCRRCGIAYSEPCELDMLEKFSEKLREHGWLLWDRGMWVCPLCAAELAALARISNGPRCHPDAYWTAQNHPPGMTQSGTSIAVCSVCGRPRGVEDGVFAELEPAAKP